MPSSRAPTEFEREQIFLALELLCTRDPDGFVSYIAGYSDSRIARAIAYDMSWRRVAHLRRLRFGKLRINSLPHILKWDRRTLYGFTSAYEQEKADEFRN